MKAYFTKEGNIRIENAPPEFIKALQSFNTVPEPMSLRELVDLFRSDGYKLSDVKLTNASGHSYTFEELNSIYNN